MKSTKTAPQNGKADGRKGNGSSVVNGDKEARDEKVSETGSSSAATGQSDSEQKLNGLKEGDGIEDDTGQAINDNLTTEAAQVENDSIDAKSDDDLAESTKSRLELAELTDATNRPKLQPPRTLETTLFDRLERLYGTAIKRVLKVQYRMNELIADFPNKTLYNSELVSDPSVAKRNLLDLPSAIAKRGEGVEPTEEEKEVLEGTVVFFDTAGCEFYERNEGDDESASGGIGKSGLGEGSKSNENEAGVVERWARKLVSLLFPFPFLPSHPLHSRVRQQTEC